MFTVNGEVQYTLNLNDYPRQNEFELEIESKNGESMLNWGIDSILCGDLNYEKGSNYLKIELNISKILKPSYVILKNVNDETAVIKILPNEDEIGEKVYVFKTGKTSVSGRTTTVSIISKRNDKNWGWDVSYKGNPIIYDFKVSKTKLVITNMDSFEEKAIGNIELSQLDSNKKIIIKLLHNSCEETEIDNIEEAD